MDLKNILNLLPVMHMTDRNPFTKPEFREAYEKYPWSRVIEDGMSFSSACELARELAYLSNTTIEVARLLVYPLSTGFINEENEEHIVEWNVRHQPDEQWGVVAPNSMDYNTVSNVFEAYGMLRGVADAEELALEDLVQAAEESYYEEQQRNYEKDREFDLLQEELYGGDDDDY